MLAIVGKRLRESVREPWVLALVLLTAPSFVLVYRLIFLEGPAAYGIAVVNRDGGPFGGRLLESMADVRYRDGRPMIRLLECPDEEAARRAVSAREASVLLVLPPGLSAGLAAASADGTGAGPEVVLTGDYSNPEYSVASLLAASALDACLGKEGLARYPLRVREESLGIRGDLSEFDLYVPGLLVLAAVMVLYMAAFSAASEIEKGTMTLLEPSRVGPGQLIAGMTIPHLILTAVSIAVTLAVALLCGFHMSGSVAAALLIGILTGLSSIGIGLVCGCLARTTGKAFLVASVPFILLMFLSGAAFPMPRLEMFVVGGYGISPFDILPPTHAVYALRRIFIHGAGVADVLDSIGFLAALSLAAFGVGVLVFRRTLRTADPTRISRLTLP